MTAGAGHGDSALRASAAKGAEEPVGLCHTRHDEVANGANPNVFRN
jgi:hypothetical protein